MELFKMRVQLISVPGNSKLCGGVTKLQLPLCPKEPAKKGVRVPVIVFGVVAGILALSSLLCFLARRMWWKKSKNQLTSASFTGYHILEVTYSMLFKATDGFSLANLIGVGSAGSVYKGYLDCIGTIVAIKVLKLQQRKASKSFTSECKALRSILQRNVVKILTVCSSIDFRGNDFKALVFEYMPNGSLDMWLHLDENEEMRSLNLLERLNIAVDVACALDYLHHHCQEPVVHCDLKPSNILLDDDMVAYVADFGLAKVLYKDVANFSQYLYFEMKGSIGYIAPEYGMGGDASTSGDVYNYGILLLEMLTGKRPTDDMLRDNKNLHRFAKTMLPERVMEIIDGHLLLEELDIVELEDDRSANKVRSKIHKSLVSLVRIGESCSEESPEERMI